MAKLGIDDPKHDVSRRANVGHTCDALLLIILATIFAASCTSRVVYETPAVLPYVEPSAININTATIEEFERLPYIGPKVAERIVRFREQNGQFRRPEDLMQIRGISERRFLVLRPLIRTE